MDRLYQIKVSEHKCVFVKNGMLYCSTQDLQRQFAISGFPYGLGYSDHQGPLGNDPSLFQAFKFFQYYICFIYNQIWQVDINRHTMVLLYKEEGNFDLDLYNSMSQDLKARYNHNRFFILNNTIILKNTLRDFRFVRGGEFTDLYYSVKIRHINSAPCFFQTLYSQKQGIDLRTLAAHINNHLPLNDGQAACSSTLELLTKNNRPTHYLWLSNPNGECKQVDCWLNYNLSRFYFVMHDAEVSTDITCFRDTAMKRHDIHPHYVDNISDSQIPLQAVVCDINMQLFLSQQMREEDFNRTLRNNFVYYYQKFITIKQNQYVMDPSCVVTGTNLADYLRGVLSQQIPYDRNTMSMFMRADLAGAKRFILQHITEFEPCMTTTSTLVSFLNECLQQQGEGNVVELTIGQIKTMQRVSKDIVFRINVNQSPLSKRIIEEFYTHDRLFKFVCGQVTKPDGTNLERLLQLQKLSRQQLNWLFVYILHSLLARSDSDLMKRVRELAVIYEQLEDECEHVIRGSQLYMIRSQLLSRYLAEPAQFEQVPCKRFLSILFYYALNHDQTRGAPGHGHVDQRVILQLIQALDSGFACSAMCVTDDYKRQVGGFTVRTVTANKISDPTVLFEILLKRNLADRYFSTMRAMFIDKAHVLDRVIQEERKLRHATTIAQFASCIAGSYIVAQYCPAPETLKLLFRIDAKMRLISALDPRLVFKSIANSRGLVDPSYFQQLIQQNYYSTNRFGKSILTTCISPLPKPLFIYVPGPRMSFGYFWVQKSELDCFGRSMLLFNQIRALADKKYTTHSGKGLQDAGIRELLHGRQAMNLPPIVDAGNNLFNAIQLNVNDVWP